MNVVMTWAEQPTEDRTLFLMLPRERTLCIDVATLLPITYDLQKITMQAMEPIKGATRFYVDNEGSIREVGPTSAARSGDVDALLQQEFCNIFAEIIHQLATDEILALWKQWEDAVALCGVEPMKLKFMGIKYGDRTVNLVSANLPFSHRNPAGQLLICDSVAKDDIVEPYVARRLLPPMIRCSSTDASAGYKRPLKARCYDSSDVITERSLAKRPRNGRSFSNAESGSLSPRSSALKFMAPSQGSLLKKRLFNTDVTANKKTCIEQNSSKVPSDMPIRKRSRDLSMGTGDTDIESLSRKLVKVDLTSTCRNVAHPVSRS